MDLFLPITQLDFPKTSRRPDRFVPCISNYVNGNALCELVGS
jgi:hypothetical protein